MLEPLDPETARETAFTAPAFRWNDTPLHPLAVCREADWLLHCRRIGLPPIQEALASTESFSAHALRLLWFVSHEPSEWLSVWMAGGVGAPIYLDTRIHGWVEENVKPGEQAAAVALALEIYERAYATRAKPVEEGGDHEGAGKAHGPAGARNISASLPGHAPDSSPKTSLPTTSLKSEDGLTSTDISPRRASSTNGPKKPPAKMRS